MPQKRKSEGSGKESGRSSPGPTPVPSLHQSQQGIAGLDPGPCGAALHYVDEETERSSDVPGHTVSWRQN